MSDTLILWRDKRGRISALRIATLAVLAWPAVLILIDYSRGALGGRPLNEVIHRTGWWALVFLLASLAVTPLRAAGRYARLVDVRRMIGVGCFAYAAAHILLYWADQGFSLVKVASEIVSRIYLTIGFAAWLGLAILAVTSNDAMVRRLGGIGWRRLHQATFVITLLAMIHYFQQTKADVTTPTLYAGLFAWLLVYRIVARHRGEAVLTALPLALMAIGVAALVFVGEAVGIALAFGQPVWAFSLQILGTAFDLDLGIRPGWWVLAAGLAVAALDLVRGWMGARAPARPNPASPVERGQTSGLKREAAVP